MPQISLRNIHIDISEFFSDYNEIGHDREMKGSNFGNKILTNMQIYL